MDNNEIDKILKEKLYFLQGETNQMKNTKIIPILITNVGLPI